MFPVGGRPAPEVRFSYAALHDRETTLIPLEWERHMTTTQIIEAARPSSELIPSPQGGTLQRFSQERYHEEICDARDADMRFATLTVGGPRLFDCEGRRFQCYLYWTPFDGRRLMARDHFPIDTPGIHRLSIRRAAGCLFARIRTYDGDGLPTGYRTLVACIESSLLHGPPDELLMQMWGHDLRHKARGDGVVILPSFLSLRRPVFVGAYRKAEAGFKQFCTEDAIGEVQATGHLFGAGDAKAFLAQISGLEWEAAIDLVEEPWQLYLICRDFHPEQFTGRRTPYKQAKLMVEAYCATHPDRAVHIRVMWTEASLGLLADQNIS
jgi:hypothetical protein